jgi:transposase
MVNFREFDRSQPFLLPPDLQEWVPADDLAHFVVEAVERVEVDAFKVYWRGTGKRQYHPRLMLALLIYCDANGISRRDGSSGRLIVTLLAGATGHGR